MGGPNGHYRGAHVTQIEQIKIIWAFSQLGPGKSFALIIDMAKDFIDTHLHPPFQRPIILAIIMLQVGQCSFRTGNLSVPIF